MRYSISSLAVVFGLASATIDINQAASPTSPLAITLTSVGNTQVKAVITNSGSKNYNIFHRGTILDTGAPVNKFQVTKGSSKAEFQGVKLRLAGKNLSEKSFTSLTAGESKEVVVDLAEIYGLSKSGVYNVRTEGHFRYAEVNSTELVDDILTYSSNDLALNVDGVAASRITKAIYATVKRSTVQQNDCTAAQVKVVTESIARCYDQATAASKAALSGDPAKFQEYFKSTSASDRKYVSNRFAAVAKECKATPGGVLRDYCTDQYGQCDDDTFAYTVPRDNNVIWCNQYWLSAVESPKCHGDDKAGTTIHEYTHADGVFSPGTEDYAYSYANCVKLTRAKALENADTYEYYANAIHLGC